MLPTPGTRKRKRPNSENEQSFDDGTISDSDCSHESRKCQTQFTHPNPHTPQSKYPSESKTFVCTYEDCGKAYNRPARLRDHVRSHTNERPFQCSFQACEKAFRRQSHLTHHVKSCHTGDRDYTCTFDGCGKQFTTATRLKRHNEAHLGRDRFRCIAYPPCNETFRKKNTLQRHIDIEHLHRPPFRCLQLNAEGTFECGAAFSSATQLKSHSQKIHGERYFWCQICSNGCTTDGKGSINGHELENKIVFRCTTNAELQTHIRDEHPPLCQDCGLQFRSNSDLAAHAYVKHSKQTLEERKKFTCEVPGCRGAFTKRSNLNAHARVAHPQTSTDRAPWICGKTSLSDSTKNKLATWDISHGCFKAFTAKASLEKHVLKQHVCSNISPRKSAILNSSAQASSREPNQETATNPNSSMMSNKGVKKMKRKNKENGNISVLSRLTGTATTDEAAQQRRDMCCVVEGCPWAFTRVYDLLQHTRTAHGLSERHVSEALVEREALEGGKFWVGGVDKHGELESFDFGVDSKSGSDSAYSAEEDGKFEYGLDKICDPGRDKLCLGVDGADYIVHNPASASGPSDSDPSLISNSSHLDNRLRTTVIDPSLP